MPRNLSEARRIVLARQQWKRRRLSTLVTACEMVASDMWGEMHPGLAWMLHTDLGRAWGTIMSAYWRDHILPLRKVNPAARRKLIVRAAIGVLPALVDDLGGLWFINDDPPAAPEPFRWRLRFRDRRSAIRCRERLMDLKRWGGYDMAAFAAMNDLVITSTYPPAFVLALAKLDYEIIYAARTAPPFSSPSPTS